MNSSTEICNLALALLGANSISNITDTDNKEARLCNAFYAPSRDQMFEDFPWNFATKLSSLNRLSTAPAFGYSYCYQLPSDCITPLVVNSGTDSQWEVVGKTIAISEDSVELYYTSRQTDVSFYTPNFIIALSQLIASNIAPGIVGGRSSKPREMLELYHLTLARAQANDGFRGNVYPRSHNDTDLDTWVTGRQ